MSCQPRSLGHCHAPGVVGGLTSKGWKGPERADGRGLERAGGRAERPFHPVLNQPRPHSDARPLAFCFWGPSWGTTTCVKPPESQPRRPRPPGPGGTPTMAAQRGPVQSHRPAARRRFTRPVRLARRRSARSAAQRLGSTSAAANRRPAGQSDGSGFCSRLLQPTGRFRRRSLSLVVCRHRCYDARTRISSSLRLAHHDLRLECGGAHCRLCFQAR
jgi:hypothetical protein